MAFRFEFSPSYRIIRIRFSDGVTDNDLTYFYRMSTLLVQSLDPLSAVIDFSAVKSFQSSVEFMTELASLPPAMPKQERLRVVVAPKDDVFRLASHFALVGEATRPNFHVVRSAHRAWAILGVQEPEFNAIPQALEALGGKIRYMNPRRTH